MILTTVRLPKWSIRAAQLAVAIGLLALLWRAADGPEAARSLASADPVWLLLGCAALTVQTILSALRWQVTARQLGIRFGAGHAVREYYLSQIVNQTLPGGMIGDAGRAVRAREQAGLMASGQAVVIERLAGQIAMFGMLAVAFVTTSLVPGGLDWPSWLAAPVAVGIAAGILLPVAFAAATRLPGTIGGKLVPLWRVLHTALLERDVLPKQIALSLGTMICNLAGFAFCLLAVGAGLGFAAIAALVPLILFTMLIPVSVSGWGLREGAAAALLPVAGTSASDGLAASVAFGLVFIVAVLPGVLLWLLPQQSADER